MLTTALLELRSSRNELQDLMVQQAHTVLESLLVSSTNALRANDQLEAEIRQRLLDNATSIRSLYERGQASNTALSTWADAHNLHRIRIESPTGQWLFSNHERIPEHDTLQVPRPDLSPIFEGEVDTLVIGMREARFEAGPRFGLALAASDRAAVIVNLDAGDLVDFRQQVGFGPLLRNIARNPGIVYIAVQDTIDVLAAAGAAELLGPVADDSFLLEIARDSLVAISDRILDSGGDEVLEVVHPFFYRGVPVGVLRLGLSMDPLHSMNSRIRRRILLMALGVFSVGVVLLVLIVARQNENLLTRQKRAIETYSGQVLDHVGDGIVVFSDAAGIDTVNGEAQTLLGIKPEEVIGEPIEKILPGAECKSFIRSEVIRDQVSCNLPGGRRTLLIAKSFFADENGRQNTILIIRDLTRLMQLEAQIRERERMEAMGAMASGLAHEIRNPLNAVGTIVQQLRTDFIPKSEAAEYDELTSIVYSEVKRINESIQNFLRMVRPEPVHPESFDLAELLSKIHQEYDPLCTEHELSLTLDLKWKGLVEWDKKQIHQAVANLIQNSIDVLDPGGSIRISVHKSGSERIELSVDDDGPGIPEDIQRRIFDLYYTTKATGTGIGLSLVHHIVQEHGGTIAVKSNVDGGARFVLTLPQSVQTMIVRSSPIN